MSKINPIISNGFLRAEDNGLKYRLARRSGEFNFSNHGPRIRNYWP